MVRIVLGILAGIAAVLATVGAIELLAHQLLPVPSDGAPVPLGVQLLVLLAYVAGAFVGGLVSARVTRTAWAPWPIAVLVAAGAIWSMFLIPHPQWMQVAAVIVPFLGAVGARHASQRARPA
jgi:hypothetical protein